MADISWAMLFLKFTSTSELCFLCAHRCVKQERKTFDLIRYISDVSKRATYILMITQRLASSLKSQDLWLVILPLKIPGRGLLSPPSALDAPAVPLPSSSAPQAQHSEYSVKISALCFQSLS